MRTTHSWMLLSAGIAVAGTLATRAQDLSTDEPSGVDSLFQRGNIEATLGGGPLFSPFIARANRPTVNYTIMEIQAGYMLNDVAGTGWLRGNCEFVGEGFAGTIFHGQGSYHAGMTLWLRYNFVPVNARILPFAQGGAGLTFSDIDRRVVGQTLSFNLNLGAGLRFLITDRWSINAEYRYQHISNANLADRNVGINSHGPILGISCFF